MRFNFLLLFTFSFLSFSSESIKPIFHRPDVNIKSSGDGGAYPVPPVTAQRLFYLQRTSNTNTIVYDLNLDNNRKPNNAEPIKAYWIRYAENGEKQDLSYIQRKFAYGLTSKALDNGNYDIRFVSYKKFPLTLMRSAEGKYHIFALIQQKQVMINRIFVKIEGGSFWFPNVVYVEIKGTDPITGREIVERFKP
jgi:hypothetical protein